MRLLFKPHNGYRAKCKYNVMDGLRLLILSDNPGNIVSMETLLRDIQDLAILTAATEEEAVQLYAEHAISIVLLDKQSPHEEVTYFAEKLRENSVPDEEPVLLAIMNHGLQEQAKRLDSNIIEYLYRPVDDTRIRTKVSLLVQMLSARRLLKVGDDEEEVEVAGQTATADEAWDDQATENSLLNGKKVLLAEDNELNSFMVTHMLSSWGLEADVVPNGREALEQLHVESYDLVLMDTHMPVMGGYDAMRLIRTSLPDPLNSIPIISLSASVMQEEQEAARRAGADEVVGKPFQPDLLHNKIIHLLLKNRKHA